MRREVSKPRTRLSKIINFAFSLAIFALGIKIFFDQIIESENIIAKIFAGAWMLLWIVVGTHVIDRSWIKKQVYVDDDQIIFSNHFKEIVIPRSEIKNIVEKKYSRGGLVIHIILRNSCEFGSEVCFTPIDYNNRQGGSAIAQELKSLIP